MRDSFKQIYDGLTILGRYNPRVCTCNPVANSFPNGAPDHSRRAYINVELGERGWKVTQEEHKILRSLNWVPEDEDQYWIHYGG